MGEPAPTFARLSGKADMTAQCFCPACGYFVDRHSAFGEEPAVPKSGDLSVCLSCGSLNVFGDDMQLSVAPTGVWKELDDETVMKIGIAQAAILERGPLQQGSPS